MSMLDKYIHYQDIDECLDAYDKYPERVEKDYSELNSAYDEMRKNKKVNDAAN